MNVKVYIFVGIGGMIGAVIRYSISTLLMSQHGFPYATLVTNLIGCFLLSFIVNHEILKRKLSPELFTALNVGLIGAFTTFSTFAVETMELWSSNRFITMSYILTSVVGGIICCYMGFRFATKKQRQTSI
ncbi:fluoride efflux transporter CrcB [Virgibacillus sp. NKC19-3]|uniref:fluoride efflux transporter CrcB n=1 Tax=Virgibacillus saliphilus TaxID=2831674 RepID=UPI001C9B1DA3|nr:fluoride efflux transporter CrcB [Virgibacillus sp. NKC19-3]MBY7144022.1 fluoride efflux transporter CrcB [Virgibacillus sp. NKC19-3]